MEPIVTSNPKVMHGTPCFAGTRVAVQTFFDHLEAGYTIDGFLEQFPTMREQAVKDLQLAPSGKVSGEHAFSAMLQHEGVGRSLLDRLEHETGVEAESVSVGECLARRCEVDPD